MRLGSGSWRGGGGWGETGAEGELGGGGTGTWGGTAGGIADWNSGLGWNEGRNCWELTQRMGINKTKEKGRVTSNISLVRFTSGWQRTTQSRVQVVASSWSPLEELQPRLIAAAGWAAAAADRFDDLIRGRGYRSSRNSHPPTTDCKLGLWAGEWK